MSADDNTRGGRSASGAEPVPRSLGRALDLLEVVVESGEVSLTAAAAAVGLTPTTARRHLLALEARGYVRRSDTGSFSTGATVLHLAATARRSGPHARMVAAAQPVLDAVTEATGESSYLAVADGDRAVYLATSESRRAIRHVGWLGKAVPMAGSAVGEVLRGDVDVSHRVGSVEPDIGAVAAGVRLAGRPVAALSVIGPAHRLDPAAVGRIRAELVGAVGILRRALDDGDDGEGSVAS